MTTHTAIPALIAEALARIDETRSNLMLAVPHAILAEQILADWKDRFAAITAHVSSVSPEVWINVWMRSMDDVIALRRHLAALGYLLGSPMQDCPDDRRQVFCLAREGEPDGIILNVRAADGEGVACRYVECGEKVVKTYRLECAP